MVTTHILLVDDDSELCNLTSEYLNGHGFAVEVAEDGETGLEKAASGRFELVVLDVMLPGINGFDVLRQLRRDDASPLPVVMLTAHGDEVDRIVGLELGADDYLSKPFNPRELLARIRAVLRRVPEKQGPFVTTGSGDGPDDLLTSGELRMDVAAHLAWCRGEKLELTQTEFELLQVLMREEGKVVQRGELARQAMGRRLLPLDRSLDLHMSKLRRKLGPANYERLRTVRGVGFLLDRPNPEP